MADELPLSAAGERARRGDRGNVRSWGEDGGLSGTEGILPDIADLTTGSGLVGPAEAYHGARAQLGLEPEPRRRDDDSPDTSALREWMGLG